MPPDVANGPCLTNGAARQDDASFPLVGIIILHFFVPGGERRQPPYGSGFCRPPYLQGLVDLDGVA